MSLDIKMQSETAQAGEFLKWDLEVSGTIVPFVADDAADAQDAAIAGYLQLGTIPQLPDNGVPWMEFLTGQSGFGEVDSAIRTTLIQIGLGNYAPAYDIVNDNIKVTVGIQ